MIAVNPKDFVLVLPQLGGERVVAGALFGIPDGRGSRVTLAQLLGRIGNEAAVGQAGGDEAVVAGGRRVFIGALDARSSAENGNLVFDIVVLVAELKKNLRRHSGDEEQSSDPAD